MGSDSVSAAAVAAPVAEASRFRLIDALRGVALPGILRMNIPGFGMPGYWWEFFNNDPSQFNFWLNNFISVHFEGKMPAMFGMMFGAGVLLFVTGKEQAGAPAGSRYYGRISSPLSGFSRSSPARSGCATFTPVRSNGCGEA